jgi:phospholipase/carboxylesterase
MVSLTQALRSPGWHTDEQSNDPVVVLLHGYGSTEHDLAGLASALDVGPRWASLRAPIDTPNGGAAWFSITTPGNPDAEPVQQATDAIWEWVDENLPPETVIVPIGFSQGGLMATQLLRTRPDRVLAPVVLGGFVLGFPQAGDGTLASNRPPVFWGRGAEDTVIAASAIERTSAWLPTHSTLDERIYPGLAHGISNSEVGDVRSFLRAHAGLGE